jgi:hypothetical protein
MAGLQTVEKLEFLALDHSSHTLHVESILGNFFQDREELGFNLLQLLCRDTFKCQANLSTDALLGDKVDG